MHKYSIYGLSIESDVEFMQLEKADDEKKADISIISKGCHEEVTDYLEKMGATQKRYEIGLEYSCFENKGGFYTIRDGKKIRYECRDGYTKEMVTGWLLGYCLAMALLQRGVLAIHCSAVVDATREGESAVLIAGEPGAGKSSTTRKLIEEGYKIMADDVAALTVSEEGAYVYPAFPYQKLCRNEVKSTDLDLDDLIYINEDKDKFLVPVKDKFVSSKRPVGFMAFLTVENVNEVKVKKMTGMDQLFAFKHNLFLHRLSGDWENNPKLGQLCLLAASKCPVYIIARPREGNSKKRIVQIIGDIQKGKIL